MGEFSIDEREKKKNCFGTEMAEVED
jgi:hypothetical protein